MSSKRVAFETLGCKLNQFETDAIAAGFVELGWEIVEPEAGADAYVVNTCTVTDKADRKSRRSVGRHLTGVAQPVVVVTGCFAESARESLEGQNGITYVVPNANKNQIPSLVDAHHRGEVSLSALPRPSPFDFPVHEKIFHTRASVKIQDGCDNFCSFCIIPSVRGRAVSRPRLDILGSARQMIALGRKELVLTGVNLGRWHQAPYSFTHLVREILDLEGDFRLRITSLEPEGLGPEFADLLLHPKMAPHLHLCLQSGSPRILLAMRREYNLEQFEALVALLKGRRSDLNLTTDLIVGFPGETENDFQKSLEALRRLCPGHVHVFPFSRRKLTRADRMVDQVSDREKTARGQVAKALSAELRMQQMLARVGSQRTVLVESQDSGRVTGGWLRGLTEDYFPVRFRGDTAWNQWARVKLTAVALENGEPVFEAQP